ncbi:MAG: HPr family phosphocarrier protein [Turicibacter sp.]|nr:HPr family phosphocarrier protein [Turicibacter sp.]
MKNFSHTITSVYGMHARPAGNLVKLARTIDSQITITSKEKKGDAKKLFSLMELGIKKGDIVSVSVEGRDEDEAIKIIEEFFAENL